MYKGLLDLHSLLRWIILILLVVNIIRHFARMKSPYDKTDKKLGLFLMISAHITLLIGLYQWILGRFSWSKVPQGVNIMKDSFWRFYLIEHPFGMIVAIILITIGKGVAKKDISDYKKHKKAATLFLLALIIILATIPWPCRVAGIGRSLVPGM